VVKVKKLDDSQSFSALVASVVVIQSNRADAELVGVVENHHHHDQFPEGEITEVQEEGGNQKKKNPLAQDEVLEPPDEHAGEDHQLPDGLHQQGEGQQHRREGWDLVDE